jgi:hypothetical protein
MSRRYCTPQHLPELYPDAFTAGSFRWLINNRENNGLAFAIKKIGKRKLLVDLDAFETWLAALPSEKKTRKDDDGIESE